MGDNHMTDALTVLLIESQPIVIAGYRRMLTGRPNTQVLEASSGADGLRLNAERKPGVAIMDLQLPDMDGLEVVKRLLEVQPNLRILIFSAAASPAIVSQALQSGATGFVSKAEPPEILMEGIEQICQGRLYIDRSTAMSIAMNDATPLDDSLKQLSSRDIDILNHLSKGLSLYDISLELNIGYRAVANHVAKIRRRLGIPNMFSLVKFAVDNAPIKRSP